MLDPSFFAAMSGNQLCAVPPCAKQELCPDTGECGWGQGAKRPGTTTGELYKGYDNYPGPLQWIPANPLPDKFDFYQGDKCPECVWNALRKDGYVSTAGFDYSPAMLADPNRDSERSASIFGLLQVRPHPQIAL